MKTLLGLAALLLCSAPAVALADATIQIVNLDGAGEGFNDPTPAAPIGGNPGVTVGQQRLIAFQAAADIWGQSIDSDVPIMIDSHFDPLTCTATTATLGAASTTFIFNNFPGAPLASTWYSAPQAESLSGIDLDPASNEVRATFNSNLGKPNCLTASPWYLGLDGNHGTAIDLVTVLLHEFAHGLGFAAFFDVQTGAQPGNLPGVFERNLFDLTTGLSFASMTNPQRVTASLNSRRVFWMGSTLTDALPDFLAPGVPLLTISAPASIAGGYSIGEADFGAPLSTTPVSANIVRALDAANGTGPSTTDACTAITNPAAVLGKLALVDRGTCGFVVKAKNVQNAGAVGMIVVDNVATNPPPGMTGVDATVVIPSVRISQADGNLIKARLTAGDTVPGSLGVDMSRLQGADGAGHAQLYATNPVEVGSSISHFDTIAFPNLLMEPFINDDLPHEVDLTLPLLLDLGWPLCHDDADCSDGNACNGNETCSNFQCVSGTPPLCSGSACLVASCDPALGCIQTPVPNGTSCSDGNACNGAETCVAGACSAGSPPICDDGNPCSSDSCDSLSGCVNSFLPDGTSCSDGTACTSGDACVAGVCDGADVDCNDNNLCTADACDAVSACGHSPVPSGTACGGGGTCNGAGSCQNAKCLAVKLVNDTPGILPSGGSALLTATGVNCGSGQVPEYRFLYKREGGPTAYSVFRDWSTSPNAAFSNAGLPSGKYTLLVRARAVGSTKSSESQSTLTLLSGNVCTAVALAVTPSAATMPGVFVNLTGTASCTEGAAEYEFSYKPLGGSSYTVLRSWGGPTLAWDTTPLDFGTYTLLVKARGAGNTTKYESQKTANHTLADKCSTLVASVVPASPKAVGTHIDILAEASCNEGTTPQLRYSRRLSGASTYTVLQDWSLATSAPWETAGSSPGVYQLRVESRSAGVTNAQATKVVNFTLLP